MARGLAPAALLLLAACHGQSGPAKTDEPQETVACALGGSLQFKPQCTVERSLVDGNQIVVVRLPDGGFHRLQVSKDGAQLEAADGAQPSQSARKGDRYEVILGQDRYVIPVKADAAGK